MTNKTPTGNLVYGCVPIEEWDRLGAAGKLMAVVNRIYKLEEQVAALVSENADYELRIVELADTEEILTDKITDKTKEVEASRDLREQNDNLWDMLQAMRLEINTLVSENVDLYHAIRGHEQALVDHDRVEVPIDRYKELCRKEEEIERLCAILAAHDVGGGPA